MRLCTGLSRWQDFDTDDLATLWRDTTNLADTLPAFIVGVKGIPRLGRIYIVMVIAVSEY